jgi:2-oxoglutarate ferredoxin oxidoreductase subunit gamma
MKELVFAGYGGQGVLTVGLIISDIAVQDGKNATWMPSYGSAMRGGTANCTVKYGDDYIYNPAQEEPDLLLAMNTPSFDAFIKIVAPGGIVLVSEMVEERPLRNDVTRIMIPCSKIAEELGHSKGANIVMTGAIVKLMKDFSMEQAVKAMNAMFGKKGKNKFAELNTRAFEAGYNAV